MIPSSRIATGTPAQSSAHLASMPGKGDRMDYEKRLAIRRLELLRVVLGRAPLSATFEDEPAAQTEGLPRSMSAA